MIGLVLELHSNFDSVQCAVCLHIWKDGISSD